MEMTANEAAPTLYSLLGVEKTATKAEIVIYFLIIIILEKCF